MNWVTLIQDVGPLIGIIIFFVWRDWKRETRLSLRVEKLEDYQKDTLMNLVEKSTSALIQNTEVMKWIGRIVERYSIPK